ncbi:N6-adenine-specific methylase, putative [Plasmodium gallinaceum]|uniref:N6-adenine-specific methylase, putative n=1 Tax=Plasmodium gallinaceum TaxID=5849 RepID=A0A1J1GRW6_PLAGA|nr:N6-adenine-specific methylase, putative [Plasmodium gallinaceum]CRG95214.1 N6-adenine-specific methylase, putative [Plasmodium gallinaceum]
MLFFKKYTVFVLFSSLLIILFNINKKFCYAKYIKNRYIYIDKFYLLDKNIKTDRYIKNVFHLDKHLYGFIKNDHFNIKIFKLLNVVKKNNKIHIKKIKKDKINEEFRNENVNEINDKDKNENVNEINDKDKNENKIINDNSNINNNEIKSKRKIIKKDIYGLPTEELKVLRLPNSKIKTKYKYCKIKKYSETININYKKKKILSIHEGKLKNKKIYSPDTYTRPVMSKVKESIFNVLTHLGIFNCYNINVIDVFSGSGNLGIECISRNARNVTFVDLSINSCRTIYENLKLCNLSHLGNRIIRSDAIELLKNPFKFDLQDKFHLAFFTPPYEQIIYSDLIHSISKSQLFHNDCLIFIEYPKEIELLPQKIDNLIGLRNRKFGRTYYSLYVLNSTGKYIANEKKNEFYPLHYNRKQRRQEKYI